MGAKHPRPSASSAHRPEISVVIPALNEEHSIAKAIASAQQIAPDRRCEIVVVDGGSKDRTVCIAEKMGAKVLFSRPGRGLQMNLGWRHSNGDCVLFLHADSTLPSGYQGMVKAALSKQPPAQMPSLLWGCFETIDADIPDGLRRCILKQAVKARTRWRHMPYGDQALFVKASLIRELGGFKEVPIMEDYDLVKRLRKHGPPAIIPHALHTSGRRWQTVGFFRTTLTNQAIILAYHCGVPLQTLAGWYRKGQSPA